MKRILFPIILFCLFFSCLSANAQNSICPYFRLDPHIGIGSGMGDFGTYSTLRNSAILYAKDSRKNPNTQGAASTTFAAGVDFLFSSPIRDLRLVFAADILRTNVSSDFVTDYIDAHVGLDYTYSRPYFYNIPLMFGGRYEYFIDANHRWVIAAQAAFGVNYWSLSTQKSSISMLNMEHSYELSEQGHWTPAFQLGIGVELEQRISILWRYYNLGNAPLSFSGNAIDYSGATQINGVNRIGGTLSPRVWTLSVGYML